jgi:hypothetical protein
MLEADFAVWPMPSPSMRTSFGATCRSWMIRRERTPDPDAIDEGRKKTPKLAVMVAGEPPDLTEKAFAVVFLEWTTPPATLWVPSRSCRSR